jgi:uncharacterized protein YegL
MESEGQKILPFYLVVDVSASMIGPRMAALNQVVPQLVDALARDPILSDKVRFALIDFSDDARVRLPLSDLLEDGVVIPHLEERSMTSYVAALELLRTEIAANVDLLKADGFEVHRPAVFFVSDGVPDHHEDWQPAFEALTSYDPATGDGFRTFPNIIPCAVADADPKVMQKLIHPASGKRAMKMYIMDPGFDPAKAITAVAEILVASVIQSVSAPGSGSTLRLPDESDLPAGLTSYSADDDLDLV